MTQSPRRINLVLRHQLIHPEINAALGRAGHHAQVLIADGNYPASSTLGPHAQLVSLNLSPGVVTVPQVLEALVTAIPIESAHTMGIPPDDPSAQHGSLKPGNSIARSSPARTSMLRWSRSPSWTSTKRWHPASSC